VKRLTVALVLAAVLVAGCGGDPQQPASTSRAPATTLESATGDPDLDAKTTMYAVLRALERHGHLGVSKPKRRDPEGGRLFGMTHSWDVRVSAQAQDQPGPLDPRLPTIPAFVNVFASNEDLRGWLDTARGFGAVVVYNTDDVWVLSLESDGPLLARSVKLARQLDRDLDAWTWGIEAIT
jgi:hypothetical protein